MPDLPFDLTLLLRFLVTKACLRGVVEIQIREQTQLPSGQAQEAEIKQAW